MTATTPQVLIVEDEADLADLYRTWLADTYEVSVAYEGRAALAALDESVDVVLLDRRIPDLSGDEVLEEIRSLDLDCRVAMVTAVTPDEDIIEMGFDDYLVKPVSSDELHAVVERLLRRSEHNERVRELFALASKKAVLDVEADASDPESSEAYAELERSIQAKSAAVEATLEDLDQDDFEVLFYDLEDQAIPDSAG